MNKEDIKPSEDGITHINVYSRGKTELGKLLSNFALTRFTHPTYGIFNSLEGFWYWAATGKVHDVLKDLHAHAAKQLGKSYKRVHNNNFESDILSASKCKIEQNPHIKELLEKNKLPLVHYYNYGNWINYKLIFSDSNRFQLDFYELYSKW